MVDYQYKNFYTVQDLIDIVRILRGPGGCPWDQVQTHESIRRDLLEEAYELVEAIDRCDPANLKEELGDVLLQVAFHTVLEDEQGGMTLDEVADGVCKKLIYRHPHVFGRVTVSGTEEVLSNWEKLKQVEKDQKSATDTLEAVARALPALWRAEKVQKKAQKAGLNQPDPTALKEELARHVQELDGENTQQVLGELLFAAVNLARQQHVDPEVALNEVTDRFIGEFRKKEAREGL